MDIGLLLLRAAIAAALLAQGGSKLRRRNRDGVVAYFAGLGFEPARLSAVAAGLTEGAAGVLLLTGAVTPLGAAAAIGVLGAAVVVNGANGWSASNGGAEYPAVLLGAVVAIAFAGPGGWSVDAGLDLGLSGTGWGIAAVGLAVVSVLPVLARRAAVLRRRRLEAAAPAARRAASAASPEGART